MCNTYSLGRQGPDALRAFFRADRDETGNMPELPGIYPKTLAPVVLMQGSDRVLTMKSWGMPSPAFAMKGKKVDAGITNVRTTTSAHWKRWLVPKHRCLASLTSVTEFNKVEGGYVWFAFGEDRPLVSFAGIYADGWTSTRKLADGDTRDDLYAFLTCPPNKEVEAIHPKVMLVFLTTDEERDAWLWAPRAEAKALQRPPLDGAPKIVGRDWKKDV